MNVSYEIDVFNVWKGKKKVKIMLFMFTDECKTEGA